MLITTEFRGEQIKVWFTGYVVEPTATGTYLARKGLDVGFQGSLDECRQYVESVLSAQGLAFDWVEFAREFGPAFRAEVR